MRKVLIVLIAVLMCIPVLALSPGMAEDAPGEESSRQGVSLTNVNALSYTNNRYPGQTEDFYLRANNVYDGSYYTSANPAPFDWQYLFNANFSFGQVVDSNFDLVTAYNPVEWIESAVSDNAGNGYDMNTWNNYDLYTPDWNWFEFRVNPDNVDYGRYYIRVNIVADVVVDFDGVSYTYATHTDIDWIQLDILNPVNYGTFSGVKENGNGETIYAGAQNERVGLGLGSNSGTISNIQGTLDIPDTHFHVLSDTATSTGTGSTWDLYWFIDVDHDTPTGMYDAEVQLTYERNGVEITEMDHVTLRFAVDWTPLLEFPDSNSYTNPLMTFTQNTPPAEIVVPITNMGNVDLRDVTVRIDMDRAKYFTNGEFYYYEGNNAAVTYEDTIFELGDLAVGQTKDAIFPDIILKDNLPPGKYMIPMDYIGYYFDNGTLGKSDTVRTGYWDEKGEWDYQTIHLAKDNPEPSGTFYPFIFVEVVDDDIGLDIYAQINTVYTPGQKSRYVTMVVYNKERYSFTSAYYWVHVDGGSPFKRVGAPDNDLSVTLPPTYGGTLSGSSSDSIYFYADLKQELEPGTHYIQVDMEAYNPQQRLVKHTFECVVVIAALTPSIQSMDVVANVTTDGIGHVTVTLKNVAFGGATNLTLYFESNTNDIKGIDDPLNVGNLMPGQTVDYTFRVQNTRPTAQIWGTYSGHIYFEYMDDGGAIRKLFSSGSESVTYVFQPKTPNLMFTNVNAPGLKPGQKFDVMVDITNIGGSTAVNVTAMYVSSNALFTIMSPIKYNIGDLEPGANHSMILTFKASKATIDATNYAITFYFAYERVNGYKYTLSEGEHESFTVRTIDEVEVNREEQVIEYKNAGQSVDHGMVILGIFIFLSVVVGMSIYTKGKRQDPEMAMMAEMSRPKPSDDKWEGAEPAPRTARPVDDTPTTQPARPPPQSPPGRP